MVQSSLLKSQFNQVGFPTFGQRDRLSRPSSSLSASSSSSSCSSSSSSSTCASPRSKHRPIPELGHPHTLIHTPLSASTPLEEHRKGRSSYRAWSPLTHSSPHRQTSPCCSYRCRQQNQCCHHQHQHQRTHHYQPRSLRLRGKARAASPCTSMDSAPLTSSCPSNHLRHSPARTSFTPIIHRPPLFPQTSFDGVNNLKARSSTPALVSILLSSASPLDTYAVSSYSWTPSSVRSFSTSGGSSSYMSEVHTPSSDEDDEQNDPNVTVVGSSCSDSSTEGTDIFWSLGSPLITATTTTTTTTINPVTQQDGFQRFDSRSSSSPLDVVENAKNREAFADALNHRLQEARFISTSRRPSAESVRSPPSRPRLRTEPAVRESVELGKCPLTGSEPLPDSPMTTTTDRPTTRPRHASLMVRPSEIEITGSQNHFCLSILRLLSIPSASASTFSPLSPSSTSAVIQSRRHSVMPVPVPAQSMTSRSRLVDPEESFHSSLPLLLLSPGPTAHKDIIRPGFPALKPQALVRFVVQLEMIRQGKILKGKGYKNWDRILVWKHDRGNKQLGNSRLRWELNKRSTDI